ncbi:MAG: CvpA family protein, partial [Oscillospiraceae bacterium]|nr:CvpA family protein [Oscillospiraceae bacterium]
MNITVYDILILLVLAAFALWGLRRGLILTLFSLVALIVALVGAMLATNLLAPTVAGWLEPAVEPTVTAAVEDALPDGWNALSAEDLRQQLEQADLPFGLEGYVEQLLEELPLDAQTLVEDVSASLSRQAAEYIASALVFLVCFVLILILWHLLAKGLNLVAKL